MSHPHGQLGTAGMLGLYDTQLQIQGDVTTDHGAVIRLSSPDGFTVRVDEIPNLVERLRTMAQHAAHANGQLPCPHPNCGPCSFDRDLEG